MLIDRNSCLLPVPASLPSPSKTMFLLEFLFLGKAIH